MSTSPGIKSLPSVRTALNPRFEVVLLNDDDHTYAYVIEMLVSVLGTTTERAYEHALEVDSTGKTPLYFGPLEPAEHLRDLILGWGPDPRISRCKGPMSAVIEEV